MQERNSRYKHCQSINGWQTNAFIVSVSDRQKTDCERKGLRFLYCKTMTNEQFIADHYGIHHQLKKLNEECFELIEAVTTAETARETTGDVSSKMTMHICEELADCFVLMSQIRQHYGIEQCSITKIYQQKIERQLKRIEDEKK